MRRAGQHLLAAVVFGLLCSLATTSEAETLRDCSRHAAEGSASALGSCLDSLPTTDWSSSTFVGLTALLDYWQGSIEAGDRGRRRYLAMRDDEDTSAAVRQFVADLDAARAAAVTARANEIRQAERRGRSAAIAEVSGGGCRTVVEASGRVVVTGFCDAGGTCVEGHDLADVLRERATFREELDRLRSDRDLLRERLERER